MSNPPEIPAARGPYRNGVKTRAAIIESAARVFGQRGFVAGSMREIAREVGVSPAAIARHFASKEELLVAVLRDSGERAQRALFGDAEGLDYFDRSVDLVRASTRYRGMVELLLTVATEATHEEHPGRDLMKDRYEQIVRSNVERLRQARHRGEIRSFSDRELEFEARSYYAMMDGLQLQWLLDPSFDLVGAWEQFYRATRARWVESRPA